MSDKNRLSNEENIVLNKVQRSKLERTVNNKILVLMLLFVLALGFLLFRVGYIKVSKGSQYEKVAVEQQTTRILDETTTPLRGKILDKNGKTMAISNTIYTVIIDIKSMYEEGISDKDREKTITTLSEVLDIDIETVRGYYELDPATGRPVNDTYYKIIAKNVSYDDGQALKESGAKGIYYEASSDRVYPQNLYASSVVGFMRGDNASTYWGLEATYDEYLQGESGRSFMAYTSDGDVATNNIAPENGDTIVTTLDLEIQSFCEDVVKKYGVKYNADHASAIVMDPNTGEVLAMSQFPTFDANSPGDISLINDPRFLPTYEAAEESDKGDQIYGVWKNFNVSSTFEPGSIYKPNVVAAALDEGVISKDDVYYCDGDITILDTTIPCWKTGGHGQLTVSGVLANSCNVGMILMGEKLGRENYYKYQHDFGYGEKTGIDLPGEESASDVIYTLEGLNPVEVATGSMGQGFNATTIQSIAAFSSIINGGYLLEPYVVSRIVNSNNEVVYSKDRTVKRQVISKDTSDYLRNSLMETVTEGTGKKVQVDGYNIGGKSGTAQQGVRAKKEYAISFEAYFPVENPQYVILSTIYMPRPYVEGETTATLMTKEIIEYIIQLKGIEPSSMDELQEANSSLTNKVQVPNFVDKSVVDATRTLNEQGFSYEIVGNGSKITSTVPSANSYVSKGSFIFLYVEPEENEDLVLLPDVTGITGKEAEKLLVDAGFEVVLVKRTETGEILDESSTTEDIRAGIVKKQMPSYNISIPAGTSIRLEIGE